MTSTLPPKRGLEGEAVPSDFAGEYNALLFVIKQIVNRTHVSALCKVIAVTGGGVGQIGYVDLQPLLNQVDGYGDAIPQGILYNVPYFRLQSGSNAIIIDPQIDDVGVALFSDRDITAIKYQYNIDNIAQVLATGANPATRRRYADGLFFGGFFNGTPTEYIQLLNGVINISAPVINLFSWTGMIAPFAMGSVPGGWLACPTALTTQAITSYPRLAAALGTTWGGDGTTTFGLPFFPAGYVPVQGTVGVLSHGKVKDHTHVSNVQAVTPFGFASGVSTYYASNPPGGLPVSPEGGPDNLAAGMGVQLCVKY